MWFGKARFAWLVIAMSAACGAAEGDGTPAAAPAANTGQKPTVVFADDALLMLLPGAQTEVVARVTPADGRNVRFALLDDSADSSLEAPEVPSDADGMAKTTLRAASRAVTFRLRATSGSDSAERTVAVGGAGFASIKVTAKYGGKRSVAAWTATASTSGRCSDQATPVHADGPLSADANLEIHGVPVGPRAIVMIRSAHAVGGCAEVDDLALGEVRPLTIVVLDAPLDVTSLRAKARFDGAKGPPATLLQPWKQRFRATLLGGAKNPWSSLLDAMATSIAPAKAPAFLAARKAGAWDAVAEGLAPAASSEIDTWLDAGASAFAASLSIEGEVLSGETAGYALFTPARAGGAMLEPASSPPRVASWVALAGDVAKLSSELTLPPSRLLAAAIETATSAPGNGSLEIALGCAAVAKKLSTLAALGCDEGCLLAACKAGTATMWQRAERGDELSGMLAKLTVTASFDATVDAESRLTAGAGKGSVALTADGVDWQTDATATLTLVPP